NRVRTKRILEGVEIEQAVGQDVEISHLETFALELTHRIERRLMLGAHRDQMLTLVAVKVRGALERKIDRFGCTGCPDQLFRIAVDESRNVSARFLDRCFGRPPE